MECALVPYSYCNPYNTEANFKSFVIQGEYVKIMQDRTKGIGFTLWDCSFVLAEYLQNHFKGNWLEKTCLELGTGCGLVSITLSLLKCKRVFSTDLEHILEIVKENIKENLKDKQNLNFDNLTVQNLEWGNIGDMEKFKYEQIDYIFCSDCLYEESPWQMLLETLLYFKNINPKLEIIFAYKKRYVYQEYFLKEIEKHFSIQEVPQNSLHDEFQNLKDSFHILILRS